MFDIVSRDLCGRHLKTAISIYRGKDPLETREAKLRDLMHESDRCERCQKLRQERIGPLMVTPNPNPFWRDADGIEAWRSDAVDFAKFHNDKDKRRDMLEQKDLFPAPELRSRLRKKLRRIRSAPKGRTPASALLTNGTIIPRVVFVTEEYVINEILFFWTHFVRANLIADLSESPDALPWKVRKQLFRVIETGMSSLEFALVMSDENRIPYWYSEVQDFAELPQEYEREDIVDIEIGRGLASASKVVFSPPDFIYCVYR